LLPGVTPTDDQYRGLLARLSTTRAAWRLTIRPFLSSDNLLAVASRAFHRKLFLTPMSTPMMVGRPLPPMPAAFSAFSSAATGHAPYDYQRRLAGADTKRVCGSQLISIPTGLG
jgi:hypothetical protein